MSDEALLVDGFEDALIGMGCQFNQDVAVYDYDRCIHILMTRDGMDHYDAVEYMGYNVIGAWVGAGTPVFVEVGKEPK